MQTKPLYLDDSYQKEMDARILEIQQEATNKFRLLLDQTVFYAMGGGQPTDQGTLVSATWKGDVYQVMIKDGELWHYVNATTEPTVGDTVHGAINWERRYKHMRLHSAGHIVDFALFLMGLSPKQLVPLKGDHGKKPYIVYQGITDGDIKAELQAKVDELIAKDLKFTWQFMPFDELKKEVIYLQPNLPTNKPLRTLTLESVGTVADGGTQLHSSGEVGKVVIDSVDTENNTTVITYSLG
jgi:alanyl-tRNA synthetase